MAKKNRKVSKGVEQLSEQLFYLIKTDKMFMLSENKTLRPLTSTEYAYYHYLSDNSLLREFKNGAKLSEDKSYNIYLTECNKYSGKLLTESVSANIKTLPKTIYSKLEEARRKTKTSNVIRIMESWFGLQK